MTEQDQKVIETLAEELAERCFKNGITLAARSTKGSKDPYVVLVMPKAHMDRICNRIQGLSEALGFPS